MTINEGEVAKLRNKVRSAQAALKKERECNERLRSKLSPKHLPSFTEQVRKGLRKALLERFRTGKLYQATANELFEAIHGYPPDMNQVKEMARSLKALMWEETRSFGVRRFHISEDEWDAERRNRA